MYHFMRRIHLFAGLILFVFVLIYSVSGFLLVIPPSRLIKINPVTTRTEPFKYAGDQNSPDLPAYIKETYDLHGQLRQSQFDKKTGARHFVFSGTRGFYDARLSKDADHINIATRPTSFALVLIQMHVLSGFKGGPIYEIWCVMLDLVAISFILFGITGVYLWYKLTKRRALGWITLAIGTVYTVAMGIWSVHAP